MRDWLKDEGLTLHQIEKNIAGGSSPDRDRQFQRIYELRDAYFAAGNPVFSIDTKAKEFLAQTLKKQILRVHEALTRQLFRRP